MPSFKYKKLISNKSNYNDYYLQINGTVTSRNSKMCSCFKYESKYEILKKYINCQANFKNIKQKCDINNYLTEIDEFYYNYKTTHGPEHCECSKTFTPFSVQLKKKY